MTAGGSPLITKIDELQEELLASLHAIRRHAAELTAERAQTAKFPASSRSRRRLRPLLLPPR